MRKLGWAFLAVFLLGGALLAWQVGFRPPDDYDDDAPIPPDANEKTEWAFARLKYPSIWRRRWRGGSWTTDYPRADRQFVQGVRRLSRVHACSAERVVDLSTDEIFYWPWVYAVEVGQWDLSDSEAARLREYLLRGGFLMVDDFHGTMEWQNFMASMRRVFPDRPVVDIDDKDAVFHVIYDLDERFQVPGVQYLYSGRLYERDGIEAKWRGIYDDKGRIMVAICHNMDLGDAWEWADDPRYPERFASLAYRIGVNYIVYAMTH
ncbi:MAG: DUF4159 domain-containing protein [Rhodospirillales bacterium]